MARVLGQTGGIFKRFHDALMGSTIDFSALDPRSFPAPLLERARATWRQRFQTEFRSIQIMTRFLTEVVGGGDPLEVYAGAIDLVEDEIKHAALCAELCRALGADPILPEPVELRDPEPYLKAPMPQRALSTAISMLAINETLSVGFIRDLHARCEQPVVHAVLHATVCDEDEHQEFGWEYIKQSLERFPRSTRSDWRRLVEQTLAPHRQSAKKILDGMDSAKKNLDAWPDTEQVTLGLFSQERQALVYLQVYEKEVMPRLAALELL